MEQIQEHLEQERKKALRQLQHAALAALFFLIILTLFFRMVVIGIFITVFPLFLYGSAVKKKYTRQIKRQLLKEMAEAYFEEVTLDDEHGFTEEEIDSWRLIETKNNFYSDDLICGKYRGCQFRRSDLMIQQVVCSGKSTTTITTFKGPYMIFDFPKHFDGYTIVMEKEFLNNGKPGGWWNEARRIKLEMEQFNQRFVVYTEEGEEAFYLLTPAFLEKLMEAEKYFEGRIYFGFIEGQFHVALHNDENAFEFSLLEPVDKETMNRIQSEFEGIAHLIDSLGLGGIS